MKHKNNESYVSNEFAQHNEYKEFRAEQYIKDTEYAKASPEFATVGAETRFGNSTEPLKEKRASNKDKSKRQLFQEAFGKLKSSLSSIGGGAVSSIAVVAAATIIVCVAIFIPHPKAENLVVYSESDAIVCHIELGELSSDVDYDIILYNENQRYVFDDVREGALECSFDNLTPKTDYTLSLIGTTSDGVTEEYVSRSVFTMPTAPVMNSFHINALHDTISVSLELDRLDPDTYYYLALSDGEQIEVSQENFEHTFEDLSCETSYVVSLCGTYREADALYYIEHTNTSVESVADIIVPELSNSTVIWGDEYNEVTLPFGFASDDENFQYGVIISDELGNELVSYYGRENDPIFNIEAERDAVYVSYRIICVNGEDVEICKEVFVGELDLSGPVFNISPKKSLAGGINAFRIPFEISSRIDNIEATGELRYVISYDGDIGQEGYLYDWRGNAPSELFIELPQDVSEFSLYFILEYTEAYGGNKRMVASSSVSYVNGTEFELTDAYADLSYYGNDQGVLEFGYSAPQGAYIEITDNGQAEIADGSVYTFTASGTHVLTYQLKDSEGNPLSEVGEITFDFDFDRSFSYYSVNPGEVVVTANGDKTINLYLAVNFESENPDIFYEIEYGDRVFTSRDPIAKIENIPRAYYSIQHRVVMKKNGVRYILENVYPSGTTLLNGEDYIQLNKTDTGMSVVFSYNEFKPSSDIIVTVNGTVYTIGSNDLVFDEEYGGYHYNIECGDTITDAYAVCYMAISDISNYDRFIETYGQITKGDIYGKVIKAYEEN